MHRTILLSLAGIALSTAALGAGSSRSGQERLMIVDRDRGRVVYDDGRNDMYCVTRRAVIGYRYDGRPIYRRKMRCR